MKQGLVKPRFKKHLGFIGLFGFLLHSFKCRNVCYSYIHEKMFYKQVKSTIPKFLGHVSIV